MPEEKINEENEEIDDCELPPLNTPKKDGPDCPFCGEPTMKFDGDYICMDCSDVSYGPDTG